MDGHLTAALDEVLEARDRGVEVTQAWLEARYPDLCDTLWDALALADRAVDAETAPDPESVGPYRILRRLGRGGMGTVYLAKVASDAPSGLTLGTRVALKVVHPYLVDDDTVGRRFLREAGIGSRIGHPNVVRVLDVGVEVQGGGFVYQALEYVEGQTLRQLLESLGPVPEPLCRHIGLAVARGLEAIHKTGAVHRDIKPENIIVTTDEVVKIMDLGVAALTGVAQPIGSPETFVGTAWYAAPEQMETGRRIDGRADLYALGLVLHELLVGAHRLAPHSHGVSSASASGFVREILEVLVAPNPDDRFASASELVQVLEAGERSAWWSRRRHRRYGVGPRTRTEAGYCGSQALLRTLRAATQSIDAHTGSVFLIEGEAGIGKSRLLDELLVSLRAEDRLPQLLLAAHGPGQSVWGGAWSGALRRLLGSRDLESRLSPFFRSAPVLLPEFIAHLDAERSASATLSEETLHTAYALVLRGLAAERPLLVVVEDLHFAREEERRLFGAVARSMREQPIVLLGTFRPGDTQPWIEKWIQLDRVQHVSLPRLGPDDLHELAHQVLGAPPAAELTAALHVRTAGNPFFALEALRELTASASLERGAGAWHLKPAAEVSIPQSIRDLVRERLGALSESDRRILQVASCCGDAFDTALVAEAAELPPARVLRRLSALASAGGLVRPTATGFMFDHHQVQETVYGSLEQRVLRRHHGAVGQVLHRGLSSASEPAQGAVACRHLLLGRSAEALCHLNPALDHLERTFQFESAVELCAEALSCPALIEDADRVRLLLRQASLLELLARPDAWGQAVEEAARCARSADLDVRVSVAIGRARFLCHVGRAAEVVEPLRSLLGELERGAFPAVHSSLWVALGETHYNLGEHEEATSCFRTALRMAREAGNAEMELRALNGLGHAYVMIGEIEEAKTCHERELQRCRDRGDVRREADALGALGNAYFRQGDFKRSDALARSWLETTERIGDRRSQASARTLLGNNCRALGDLEGARVNHERVLALCAESGAQGLEATALANFGNTYAADGRYAEAVRLYGRALALHRRAGHLKGISITLAVLAEGCRTVGRLKQARSCFDEALQVARSMGSLLGESGIRGMVSVLEEDAGTSAETLLRRRRELLEFQERVGNDHDLAQAQLGIAHLLLRLGRTDQVTEALDRAAPVVGRTGQPIFVVEEAVLRARVDPSIAPAAAGLFEAYQARLFHDVRMRLAFELWQATGNAQYLELARTLLAHLRDHAPDDCKETVLTRVRLHRCILRAWSAHLSSPS